MALFLAALASVVAGCGRAPETEQRRPPASAPAPVAAGGRDGKAAVLPSGRVTEVIDGDTVEVTLDNGRSERVRLIGVDTPEVSGGDPQPYGPEAAAFTEKNLAGRPVWLETDVGERDRYGRLLAYVWLSTPEDRDEAGVRAGMFNARLVAEGYAQVFTVPPNVRYAELFTRLQKEAREAGRGIWGLPARPESYYVANANTKKFHRPDCRWAREIKPENQVRFKTRDTALDAGYSACRDCRP